VGIHHADAHDDQRRNREDPHDRARQPRVRGVSSAHLIGVPARDRCAIRGRGWGNGTPSVIDSSPILSSHCLARTTAVAAEFPLLIVLTES